MFRNSKSRTTWRRKRERRPVANAEADTLCSNGTMTVKQSGYNSNRASEFHVLACLYRLGHDAALTLGNKKSVDIAVA